ncbi:hypothetical protein SAMN04487948_103248 [Halogranum amylolyticum]|uniref:DUF8118 domain-containing protein n=1 Tax=Halogranum amylolyticum TaxID=660520 RepID=A0A1H8QQ65_9EURY|nr:hypothetical protein [Halogranum amylolyticum]SEO56360.1 hypothetical protein SAMN04487948_103248 [Halogranum amylolyticum]
MSPLSVTPGLTQEATDRPNDQPTDTNRRITGPHDGRDSDGALDHRYWRCERCGFESADPALRTGCFRCGTRHQKHGGDDAD